MNWTSIVLLFIIVIPVFCALVGNRGLIKLDKKHHWILVLFAVFSLAYFIGARWFFEWRDFLDYAHESTGYLRSVYYSKVFLLDLCPLMALLLPLAVIFDSKRRYAKILCPLTIIGSLITLFGQCVWQEPINFWEYLFIGEDGNRLYFMMHFLSLLLALWVLIISTNFNKWNVLANFIFLVCWLIYVLAIVNLFDIQNNATGLVPYDWINPNGEYHTVYRWWPLKFPWIVAFWYASAVFANWIIMLLKNICFRNPQIKIKKNKKKQDINALNIK